jgi:hypothetical protein
MIKTNKLQAKHLFLHGFLFALNNKYCKICTTDGEMEEGDDDDDKHVQTFTLKNTNVSINFLIHSISENRQNLSAKLKNVKTL